MDHKKAIKQYSRSSADQETPLPHELRPVPILQMTMNYLMHNILDLIDTPDVSIHFHDVNYVANNIMFNVHCILAFRSFPFSA